MKNQIAVLKEELSKLEKLDFPFNSDKKRMIEIKFLLLIQGEA